MKTPSDTNPGNPKFASLDEKYFGKYFSDLDRGNRISSEEEGVITFCRDYVDSRFHTMKYILGLAIDFVLLAQSICRHDESLKKFEMSRSEESIFTSYTIIEQRGSKKANTLTLKVGKKAYGIRKFEELVMSYFYEQRKLGYPSAYVYNTGQWAKFKDLLVAIFKLSANGRFLLITALLDFGNASIKSKQIKVVVKKSFGVFEDVIRHYERSTSGENGGLTFQAMVYGFISVLYGHLNLSASSVRTGSARQHRFGDIDAHSGADLVLSVEVKDFELTISNYKKEVGSFLNDVALTGVWGLIFCRRCSPEVQAFLKEIASTVTIIENHRMLEVVTLWDDYLQRKACEGMLHFISNIEHSESAAERLQTFLFDRQLISK